MSKLLLDRRDWIRVAGGSVPFVSASGVAFALPTLEPDEAERRGAERPQSLIVVWLDGGPSQLETFDPHPGTPIGGPTRAIPTTLPNVAIASHYPRLAEQLQHLSVIRSLVSKEGDHERASYFVKTGYRPDPTLKHPAVGAILARELPADQLEIPAFISLGFTPFASRGGYLGARYDAFQVSNPGQASEQLRSIIQSPREQVRRDHLAVVTEAFAQGRAAALRGTLHQQAQADAQRMIASEQRRAFELEEEPQTLREAYGDTQFGRGCLVARRLVELGVRAIEVTLGSFDGHDNNFELHQRKGEELDRGLSALLVDLRERDLFASTIVLCIGEFGRTPRINRAEGRDHWPNGFSCLVGGGGLASGVLIGATDPSGESKVPEDPIQVADLYATLLFRLGIDPAHEVATPIGRPMKFSDGKPIARLL